MLPESKNLQVVADNIRKLESQIKEIDPGIPSYSEADSGKILSVDSDGDLEWRDETEELPSYSSSDDGKILGVDSNGDLEWRGEAGGSFDYSTSEVDTGQKWTDGSTIYAKTFIDAGNTGHTLTITTNLSNVSKIIKIEGTVERPDNHNIFPIPSVNTDGNDYGCGMEIKSDFSEVYVKSGQWNPSNVLLTLFYIKSSNTNRKRGK